MVRDGVREDAKLGRARGVGAAETSSSSSADNSCSLDPARDELRDGGRTAGAGVRGLASPARTGTGLGGAAGREALRSDWLKPTLDVLPLGVGGNGGGLAKGDSARAIDERGFALACGVVAVALVPGPTELLNGCRAPGPTD